MPTIITFADSSAMLDEDRFCRFSARPLPRGAAGVAESEIAAMADRSQCRLGARVSRRRVVTLR